MSGFRAFNPDLLNLCGFGMRRHEGRLEAVSPCMPTTKTVGCPTGPEERLIFPRAVMWFSVGVTGIKKASRF